MYWFRNFTVAGLLVEGMAFDQVAAFSTLRDEIIPGTRARCETARETCVENDRTPLRAFSFPYSVAVGMPRPDSPEIHCAPFDKSGPEPTVCLNPVQHADLKNHALTNM